MKRTLFQRLQIWAIDLFGAIHWNQRRSLSEQDRETIYQALRTDYYVIATRRDNHLSTWMIGIAHWFLTGNWGYYSHVLMNLENEVDTPTDLRLIEATSEGVHYSTFEQVFDGVYSVALLRPKNLTTEEWTRCLDNARQHLGVPYDNLFDLRNQLEINCVELVRLALTAITDYETRFPAFEALIRDKKKLTPQMFASCSDFEVVARFKR
jgi:Permuted papain-like amidase enzyme, YaeF/YiiX, C92 family